MIQERVRAGSRPSSQPNALMHGGLRQLFRRPCATGNVFKPPPTTAWSARGSHGRADAGIALGPVKAVACEKTHPAVALPGDQSVAVMLYFVNPLLPDRRLSRSGRDARLDHAGTLRRLAGMPFHGPKMARRRRGGKGCSLFREASHVRQKCSIERSPGCRECQPQCLIPLESIIGHAQNLPSCARGCVGGGGACKRHWRLGGLSDQILLGNL
jgi:hypothetical protein